jgi:hypothetical protein
LSISRECINHLDWPGAAQICRIERHHEKTDKIGLEIAYAVTSISRKRADLDLLLALWRGHWRIEIRSIDAAKLPARPVPVPPSHGCNAKYRHARRL